MNDKSQVDELIEKVDQLATMGNWLRAILVASFALGVWVATQQTTLTALNAKYMELRDADRTFQAWKESVQSDLSAIKADQASIKEDTKDIKQALRSLEGRAR